MWFESIRLIWRQNRFLYLFFFFFAFALVLGSIFSYPGEEGLQGFFALMDTPFGRGFVGQLFEQTSSENPGMFLYLVFLCFIAYLSNIFPIFGLWVGGSGIVEEINSGMADIYVTSPHKREYLLYRHLLAHLVFFTSLTMLVFLQIPFAYEITGNPINYTRVALTFILYWITGVVFYAIAFFFSVTSLRNDIGRGIAGLVFMAGFLGQFVYNSNASLENLKYLSLLYYLNPISVLLEGKGLTVENFFPLILAFVLIIGGVLIFRRRDPLPLQLRQDPDQDQIGGEPRTKYRFIKPNIEFNVFSRFLNKISPISAEQWRADRTMFLFFLILIALGVFSIIIGHPSGEDSFQQLSAIYVNNPVVTAILRGYDLAGDPLAVFLGQFYGYTWLYFAPIVIIGAARIVERDYSSRTIDLVFGNPVTPKKIMFSRIVTVIFEIILLTLVSMVILLGGEIAIQRDTRLLEQAVVFGLIPIMYGTFLAFLVAVAIIFPPNNRKRVVYGLGGLTIILAVLPYFDNSLMPFRYLSLIHYFDLIGILGQNFQIQAVGMLFVLGGVFVASLAFISYYSNEMTIA